MSRPARVCPSNLARFAGLTLIELMVSMLISSLVIVGAVSLLADGQKSHRAAESVARLEEIARYAIAMLDFDASLAGFWGFTSHAARETAGSALPAPTGSSVAADCGPGWTVALDEPLGGSNNSYAWDCAPYARSATPGADTLVLRRAALEAATTREADRLYVLSTRLGTVRILPGNEIPAIGDPALEAVHELVVHGYYIAESSSLSTPGHPVPSLRMKTLVGGSLGPRIIDQEVFPGVEDMQIELGVDADAPGASGRGIVDFYLSPGDPALDPGAPAFLPDAVIRTIRVWLLVRAEWPENGFVDNRSYAYADRLMPPPNDAYRRELVSSTVYLRNTGAGIP